MLTAYVCSIFINIHIHACAFWYRQLKEAIVASKETIIYLTIINLYYKTSEVDRLTPQIKITAFAVVSLLSWQTLATVITTLIFTVGYA